LLSKGQDLKTQVVAGAEEDPEAADLMKMCIMGSDVYHGVILALA
jgi:hypothetical protein